VQSGGRFQRSLIVKRFRLRTRQGLPRGTPLTEASTLQLSVDNAILPFWSPSTGLGRSGCLPDAYRPARAQFGCATWLRSYWKKWSEWRDSNPRPLVPQTSALTGLRYTPTALLIGRAGAPCNAAAPRARQEPEARACARIRSASAISASASRSAASSPSARFCWVAFATGPCELSA
jgi:hypothetical protein